MSNKQTDEQGKPLTYWGGLDKKMSNKPISYVNKITYVALDYEDGFPITSADSFDNLKLALDNYCGADERKSAKCLGFTPYNSKYGGDLDGFYEYECCEYGSDWNGKTFKCKFGVWCIEFYPLTKIERK